MAFRFRKRIKIIPGIYLNISKSGISTSIGPRGINVNVNKTGTHINASIPGTGISYREKISDGRENPEIEHNDIPTSRQIGQAVAKELTQGLLRAFANKKEEALPPHDSSIKENIAPENQLVDVKEYIEEARRNRIELTIEKNATEKIYAELLQKLNYKQNNLFQKMFTSRDNLEALKSEVEETSKYLSELEEQLQECTADINVFFDDELKFQYNKVVATFELLTNSAKIWDVTVETENYVHKSSAKTTVNRQEVRFSIENIAFIKSDFAAFYLQNANGNQICLYPAFMLLIDSSNNLSFTDINNLNFTFNSQRFLENKNHIPIDSKIIDETWYKVNKNGTPDMRFAGNFKIPVVQYGQFKFSSNNGLNETYIVSNYEYSKSFAEEFSIYLSMLKSSKLS